MQTCQNFKLPFEDSETNILFSLNLYLFMETGNFQLEMEEFDTSTDEILSQMEMPDIKDYEAQQEMKDFKSIYVPRRFSLPTTEQELQTAASKSYSDNTKRKSQWVMRVYQAWVTQ